MSKNDSINLGRQPPDEAILIAVPGVTIRLSRWGVAAIIALCFALRPEDIGNVIAILGNR